ncbi:hypothetical protein QBC42DRAFT_287753 [Cladorrhinum samala]|uniref:Uncharacterized protein n=1 Tax=Cladorrhinum samala TaxID=585594 RepID=A0AAV9HKB3_9PEZI|nr:hypothetical protein QBC42DRAFT_287753 [Cladorrhinum samala]
MWQVLATTIFYLALLTIITSTPSERLFDITFPHHWQSSEMPRSAYAHNVETEDHRKQLAVDPRGPWTRAPAWAENRADLIESLPYFDQAQRGVYQSGMVIHGALIDGHGGEHVTHFDDDIIITKLDGGHGEESSIVDPYEKQLLAAHATKEAGRSVGLILGEA